jgi:bifunctional DNase/RNase
MENKIQVVVLGLAAHSSSSNAYALYLKEFDGKRKFPIIIGAFEAQSIALELEGVQPPRPMTHDLIKNIIENLNASLTEVYINDLLDGTFYAKLIFSDLGLEIDARPSDAIAIAVRCNVPIYVSEEILEETAIIDSFGEDEPPPEDDDMPYAQKEAPKKSESRVEMLQRQLDEAIKKEEYEKAAQIRDELKRILESS